MALKLSILSPSTKSPVYIFAIIIWARSCYPSPWSLSSEAIAPYPLDFLAFFSNDTVFLSIYASIFWSAALICASQSGTSKYPVVAKTSLSCSSTSSHSESSPPSFLLDFLRASISLRSYALRSWSVAEPLASLFRVLSFSD